MRENWIKVGDAEPDHGETVIFTLIDDEDGQQYYGMTTYYSAEDFSPFCTGGIVTYWSSIVGPNA